MRQKKEAVYPGPVAGSKTTTITEPWWRPTQYGPMPGAEVFVDREIGDFLDVFRAQVTREFGRLGVSQIDWAQLGDEIRMLLHAIFERMEERESHQRSIATRQVVNEAVQGALAAVNRQIVSAVSQQVLVEAVQQASKTETPKAPETGETSTEGLFPGIPLVPGMQGLVEVPRAPDSPETHFRVVRVSSGIAELELSCGDAAWTVFADASTWQTGSIDHRPLPLVIDPSEFVEDPLG